MSLILPILSLLHPTSRLKKLFSTLRSITGSNHQYMLPTFRKRPQILTFVLWPKLNIESQQRQHHEIVFLHLEDTQSTVSLLTLSWKKDRANLKKCIVSFGISILIIWTTKSTFLPSFSCGQHRDPSHSCLSILRPFSNLTLLRPPGKSTLVASTIH